MRPLTPWAMPVPSKTSGHRAKAVPAAGVTQPVGESCQKKIFSGSLWLRSSLYAAVGRSVSLLLWAVGSSLIRKERAVVSDLLG